ncbi:MAG: phosphatidylglycerophosphatase A [Kiritimatiellae bacterium]|nr:phosphatidylglycerophosphatase A [Kiritimatiellia bacterium]
MKRKLTLFVASGFGLGLVAPFAPGTFGSLPGLALACLATTLPLWLQIPLCTLLTLAAVPVCGAAEKYLGIKDDGRIAADEWMLFPIAVIGLPLSSLPWWTVALFFLVVRIMDIVKPYPCRGLQSIPGGRGIVVDDFAANLYSLAVNWAIFRILISLRCI